MHKTSFTPEPPCIRLVGAGTALASGLVTSLAAAAPGDLDPAFGDVGRASALPGLEGAAWAIEADGDGDLLLAGFEEYCYYNCEVTGFAGRLLGDGKLDPGFAALQLANTRVLDVALQSDGKAVGVGTTVSPEPTRLTVFRLDPDGSLDAGFGTGGIVHVGAATAVAHEGKSLVIETDGRIVVAGIRDGRLLVLRLRVDGTLDPDFGTAGEVAGPAVADASWPARILRVPGGYRVAVHTPAASPVPVGTRCRVVGITTTGTLDAAFGSAGVTEPLPGSDVHDTCPAIARQADGRLVVAGARFTPTGTEGLVARMLADGSVDPGFSGAAVAGLLREASALAIDERGAIAVAGYDKSGLTGGTVVRLQANGLLDSLFGRAGASTFVLREATVTIGDMQPLAGGALVLTGGDYSTYPYRPYAVRLLGDDAGGGPGVLDIRGPAEPIDEGAGPVALVVRRVGGSSGAVGVTYRATSGSDPQRATEGADFTAVQGRLDWADGEVADKTILVPIVADPLAAEGYETFNVTLSSPEGGAGFGGQRAVVWIGADGAPAGVFTIRAVGSPVLEGGFAQFAVSRANYSAGAVSVTVRLVSGSATLGEDFTGNDVTLTWANGDLREQFVSVPVALDSLRESEEAFTAELTNASGGALIAPQATARVSITDVPPPKSGGGGGGHTGGLAALLLGLAGLLRRRTTTS